MSLLVIVPTRGRPQSAVDLESQIALSKSGDTEVLFCIDDDDPWRDAYTENLSKVRVGPRLRLGGTLNAAALAAVESYEHLAFMGDDHRPRTQGWDTQMVGELDKLGPPALAYGNDLLQGPLLPTAVFMTSDIVKKLGYMVPPTLVHMYLDNFWLDLGMALRKITYRNDVIIEHMHPIAGKAEWDDGYVEVNAGSVMSADEKSYRAYQATQFEKDVQLLGGESQ